MVTAILISIAGLSFTFSFGNIWTLGRHLLVPAWIAPLVGPTVDLWVVGLLVGIRYLTLRGVPLRRLRAARCLLIFSGSATLALNVAEPIIQGAYGRAAFDAAGPLMLLGWSEVGPGLLYLIHTVRPGDGFGPSHMSRTVAGNGHGPTGRIQADISGQIANGAVRTASRTTPGRTEPELVRRALQIDRDHRTRYGHPISADNLRRELRVGSARARETRSHRSRPLK